jgi:hypothetical protein
MPHCVTIRRRYDDIVDPLRVESLGRSMVGRVEQIDSHVDHICYFFVERPCGHWQ